MNHVLVEEIKDSLFVMCTALSVIHLNAHSDARVPVAPSGSPAPPRCSWG